jgi:hypothetical protein
LTPPNSSGNPIGAIELNSAVKDVNISWKLGVQRSGVEEQEYEVLHKKMVAPEKQKD